MRHKGGLKQHKRGSIHRHKRSYTDSTTNHVQCSTCIHLLIQIVCQQVTVHRVRNTKIMFTCDLCQLVILVKWIHNSSNFHASCKLHAQNIVSRLFEVVTEKLLSYTCDGG